MQLSLGDNAIVLVPIPIPIPSSNSIPVFVWAIPRLLNRRRFNGHNGCLAVERFPSTFRTEILVPPLPEGGGTEIARTEK